MGTCKRLQTRARKLSETLYLAARCVAGSDQTASWRASRETEEGMPDLLSGADV